MRRLSAALAALVLGLSAMACASAVELKADQIRPFDDNVITVSSEEGGLLTIEAVSGSVPLENPVTDMKIGPGTVDIPWAALTYGGEPLQTGKVTLRATLRGADRTTEAAEIRTAVGKPVPAVVACLPASRTFYADGKNQLKIECAVSNHGAIELSIAPKADPENEVWHFKTTYSDKAPLVIRWDGRGKDRSPCPPGDYVISAWSVARSGYVQTAEVTLLSEPLPEPALALTGPLIPEDLSDDAAVWAALISPVVVGEGPEGKGLYIMADKTAGAGRIASVSCRTVGVEVLEICDDHWVKIGVWRQARAQIRGYDDVFRVIRVPDAGARDRVADLESDDVRPDRDDASGAGISERGGCVELFRYGAIRLNDALPARKFEDRLNVLRAFERFGDDIFTRGTNSRAFRAGAYGGIAIAY